MSITLAAWSRFHHVRTGKITHIFNLKNPQETTYLYIYSLFPKNRRLHVADSVLVAESGIAFGLYEIIHEDW